MNIETEIKWLYYYYKKGLGVPDCWDVDVKENICYKTKEDYPIFIYDMIKSDDIYSIKDVNYFVVVESALRCVWFSRNNIGKNINVCKLGKGIETVIDENRLIEMRSEIMGVINHIHNKDFGMAKIRAEMIRDKINKLI